MQALKQHLIGMHIHISKMASLASENKIQNYFTSSEEKEDKKEGYDITEVSLCL